MSDVRNRGIFLFFILIISLSGLSYSQEFPAADKPTVEFGIYDRTGDNIPPDLSFFDEYGSKGGVVCRIQHAVLSYVPARLKGNAPAVL